MSAINIIFDNQLEQSPIEVPLEGPTQEEVGDELQVLDQSTAVQTMIHGVCTPIFKICSRTFRFDEVELLTLDNTSILPSLTVTVIDRGKYLANLDSPSTDNELRLQILPPFDNAYKKIDLTFKIEDIHIMGDKVKVVGKYKNTELDCDRLESYGEISTYDLFNKIAIDTKLGFASNIKNSEDKRYIYSCNNTYLDLMREEISNSGTATTVLDYWIDLWNNINLVDIYERYNAIDSNEDLKVWIVNGVPEKIDKSDIIEPSYVEAIINNSFAMRNSQLYTDKYDLITSSNINKGTDKVYTIYKDGDVIDTLVQDGNTHKDIYTKFFYLGENIGDYEYLLANNLRSSFLQFMNSVKLDVHLKFPLLGLMRGHKVRFSWFELDEVAKNNLLEIKKNLNIDITSNDPEIDAESEDDKDALENPDKMIINKQISGQYLITGTILKYSRGEGWDYKLTLVRPRQQQNSYLRDE